MDQCKKVFGIDISKAFFNVADFKGNSFQFPNELDGFMKFNEIIPKNALIVMEATGYYHQSLSQFLHEKGYFVSVVNPLSVKRFMQMKLLKVKTDKSDAKIIYEYAIINKVPAYKINDKINAECFQLISLADIYTKQRTAFKNKLQGEESLKIPSKTVYNSLKRQIRILEAEIKKLDLKVVTLITKKYGYQLDLLNSIPGIGIKTATFLIILTDGFNRFQNSKQLCCYAGITPVIRQSGISVRGRSKISKVGNKKLRNLLFLCSFSACKYNKSCKNLYERIVAKGKSKKLALIAVSNKLLKQAFAIIKSGIPYDEKFDHKKLENNSNK